MYRLRIKHITHHPNLQNHSIQDKTIDHFYIEEATREECFAFFKKNYLDLFIFCDDVNFEICESNEFDKFKVWLELNSH